MVMNGLDSGASFGRQGWNDSLCRTTSDLNARCRAIDPGADKPKIAGSGGVVGIGWVRTASQPSGRVERQPSGGFGNNAQWLL